jgi:DNA-binding Xre family transcriptional regulator
MNRIYVKANLKYAAVQGVKSTTIELVIEAETLKQAIEIAEHNLAVLRGEDFDFTITSAI